MNADFPTLAEPCHVNNKPLSIAVIMRDFTKTKMNGATKTTNVENTCADREN